MWQLGILCLFVYTLFARFKTFSPLCFLCSLFFIYIILRKMCSYVILFRFIAKSNYWSEDTAYYPHHTISQQSPCHVSDVQTEQSFVFEHVSFHLPLVTLSNWHFVWFSPGTSHSPVSTLTVTLPTHTMTTVHTTQSHNSTPSLSKSPVCVWGNVH